MAYKQEKKTVPTLAILAEHFFQKGKDVLEQSKPWRKEVAYGDEESLPRKESTGLPSKKRREVKATEPLWLREYITDTLIKINNHSVPGKDEAVSDLLWRLPPPNGSFW